MATWTLLARMPDRTIGGLLKGWALSLTLKLNEVGSWVLAIPREQTIAGDWPTPGAGLILARDGDVVASGNLDDRRFQWSADPGSDAAGQGRYTLTGDTDLARLAYRICYPTPSAAWEGSQGDYWRYPFDGSTSHAEDVMRVTVNYQAGSLALSGRRVPGLRLGAATGAGSQVRISERFTPLLDALRKTALAGGGLAFDVLDTLDGGAEFVVRQPADRTTTARFGIELGNITDLDLSLTSPILTVALIAAQGELDARELAEIPDPTADPAWGRREMLLDQRQVDDTLSTTEKQAEYQKAADDAFTTGAQQAGVTARILDTPTVAWGRDYTIGDKVSVLTPFGPIDDLIRQVDIDVTDTGVETISSIIGQPDATTGDPLEATVRRLNARISQIERAL